MYNPFSLKGKTIFVTGASSGIGRAVAIECSKMGAKLIITGRDPGRLNETFSGLIGDGHQKFIADLVTLCKTNDLSNYFSEIDGIVHCAGIAKTLPFQFTTLELLEQTMNVNFTAPTILTQQLIKNKKVKKGGSIVFISSISGISVSIPGNSMYSASKGAVNGMIKTMALEMASKGIRINSVNPGMIVTDILKEGTISEDQLRDNTRKYPISRYGKPEEVAWAVIYLLSDAAAWVTGSGLVIDGGFTLQ
jgi:NAD(P)-dependent dehydrogenase (short-subunit alcohol dehydrogenase family)